MATGKTVAKHIKVQIDDTGGTARDISNAVDSISNVGIEMDSPEVQGFSDGWKNVLLGLGTSDVEISGPLDNSATTGAHTVLSAINGTTTGYTLDVRIGIRAASTTGDPKWSGEYLCVAYNINAGSPSDAVKYTARLRPFGATAAAWSTV